MASNPFYEIASYPEGPISPPRLHRFGEHGVLLALPLSLAMWAVIAKLVL